MDWTQGERQSVRLHAHLNQALAIIERTPEPESEPLSQFTCQLENLTIESGVFDSMTVGGDTRTFTFEF